MDEGTTIERLRVDESMAGLRVDAAVARLLPGLSRSQIRRLMEEGLVLVDSHPAKPSKRVAGGEEVVVTLPPPEPLDVVPQDLDLDILYEDEHIVVVDKPAGMTVHPGAGVREGTLVNALLARCSGLSGVGGKLRPGIVHRLDKGTSGVMVAAKNDAAHTSLVEQFKARAVEKRYVAVAAGRVEPAEGRVEMAIGRHRSERKRMSPATRKPREAVTEWRVVERLQGATVVEVMPRTGRTHQIRVHFKELGFPLVGDPVYGGLRGLPPPLREAARRLGRPALHAAALAFHHPATGEWVEFAAPLPADMVQLMESLRGGGEER